MSINEGLQWKPPVQWPMPSETTRLAAVAGGLLIFHILVATMLMPAQAGPATPEQEVLLRLCD
jgi:hypothetical protein